jgi:hypothetical protein
MGIPSLSHIGCQGAASCCLLLVTAFCGAVLFVSLFTRGPLLVAGVAGAAGCQTPHTGSWSRVKQFCVQQGVLGVWMVDPLCCHDDRGVHVVPAHMRAAGLLLLLRLQGAGV